ncbi:MAG: cob(I)yrinic acid a,c-diamide adenosyltransferase [Actinomycetota bacterium]|nr:cob(I)yrinic acid a,c-diamide adenosyltransferase [Actinomycetota bacterium]
MEKGFVQVYTGDGKGKTTAALGLGMRAAGWGFNVFMVQFLKGRKYGEIEAAKKFPESFKIVQSGLDTFVKRGEPTEEDMRLAHNGIDIARKAIMSSKYDVVILDEINCAVDLGVIGVEEVIPLVDGKPESVELILTGRGAPEDFLDRADIITEMKNIRHCFDRGIKMRKGIEY